MKPVNKYIAENVFCRCGQAVSALVAAELVARPELPISETEIFEWWLVSSDLAERLRAKRAPVLHLHELHMWGRTSTGVPLADDQILQSAIALNQPPAKTS